MSTDRATRPRTALVLGGGGITGIAWELGLLEGLAETGVELATADMVVGTSAGSVVGAQVTGDRSLGELYDEQLRDPRGESVARLGPAALVRLAPLMLLPGRPETKRRRVGAAARRAHPEPPTRRLEVIESRIRTSSWPDRDLRITTVDAGTGALRVFDSGSGADLVRVVAASCAVPLVYPPVDIDESLYVDGGVRSTANADLARGADVVVVLAPLPRSPGSGQSIPAQLARLGDRVRSVVVSPDQASLAAIGKNVLDPRRRADAARAGLAQAAGEAARVSAVWPAAG